MVGGMTTRITTTSTHRSARRRLRLGALVATALVIPLSACMESDQGGATACQDFRDLSASSQENAVQSMLDSHDDPTPLGIAVLSVQAFCAIYPDRQIDGVYTG